MNKILNIIVFTLIFAIHSQSQTYEEFVKQRQTEFDRFRKEQADAISGLRKEYADYIRKKDREYADYLKNEWNKFQVFTGKKAPDKPKPKAIPAFTQTVPDVKKSNPVINKIPALPPRIDIPPTTLNLAKLPLIQKPVLEEDESKPKELAGFKYCGEKITIDYDPAIRNVIVNSEGRQKVSDYWQKMSSVNYQGIVNQLMSYKQKFNLNDFGYYQLTEKLAESVFTFDNQSSMRVLLTWFIMVRSGYDIRIAYNANHFALLIPSFQTVYGKSYLTIGNMKFYLFTPFDEKEIFTYEKTYESANYPVDFCIKTAMKFTGTPVKKELEFKFREKSYPINVLYDPGVIEFYKNYPQVDAEIYFDAAVSVNTKQSLDDAFKPVISSMKQEDAVNFLLTFVQKGFAYKTDPEQFGREKFFFAEELFFYPACDCEDRSVLFSYLVRHLLSLKMVGLEAPEHIFTAIHFTTDAFGDYLTYQGDSYIVADPTYINAPFGRTMPSISLKDTRIIVINNSGQEQMSMEAANEIAAKAGIKRAGGFPNIVLDKSGNFFVTGYFSGTFQKGNFSAKGYLDAQSYIVARMDQKGNLLWADNIPCTENAAGVAIHQDEEGNIFVAGSFNGKMLEFQTLKNSDVFIARYTPGGDRIWTRKCGFDSLNASAVLTCSVSILKTGKKIVANLVEYSKNFNEYGLSSKGDCVIFSGYSGNTLVSSVPPLALNTMSELNYPDLLKKEYDQFTTGKTDKAVAGLFAISSLIKTSGMVISGKDIQKTFDKYNPGFKKRCPNMYKLIGKVNLLKNSNNIVTISTEDGKDVLFDKLKLKDKAELRVTMLPDGNAQIEAISGVKVGKMVVWYPLNYIRLFAGTGDLLFDYDSDHSQARYNLRKDILN